MTNQLVPWTRTCVMKWPTSLKKEGMTQLVVTHDMDFAEKIADKILKVQALDARK